IVDVNREYVALGGAANVSANLRALGDSALTLGALGDDSAADQFRDKLKECGLTADLALVDSSRQTTVKTRIIAETQQLARIDREDKHEIGGEVEGRIMSAYESVADDIKAVIISDYGKGVITRSLLEKIIPDARARGLFIAVDPKETHFMNYTDVSLITPNHHEASFAAGTRITNEETLQVVGCHLMDRLHLGALLITRGAEGMTLFESDGGSADHTLTHFSTVAQKVFDVTGAGDTVIAAFVSAVAAGATLKESAIIANTAAGIVVGQLGAATVTLEELAEALSAP
ncbi:MAG: bifunctional hydroxymethylpyrimidine kinase/phosphomethylpyrimidine kinase, partial [candidate division Zixibacteria bacterium]|nr:bifunctional hydroxymethylpyrimidine kinase/phosphomethylpyrimidine kinase [candidate division Zixibacteria bacterium]